MTTPTGDRGEPEQWRRPHQPAQSRPLRDEPTTRGRGEPTLPQRSSYETDVGWGDEPDDADDRLRRDIPPHHIPSDAD